MRVTVGDDGIYIEKYDVGVNPTWRDIRELEKIRREEKK